MSLQKAFLAILTMMIFGLGVVLTKLGLREFSPLLFAFFRYLFVLPLLPLVRRPDLSWAKLSILAILMGGVYIAMTNVALALGASSGLVLLFIQSGSFFAVLFSYLAFQTRPTLFQWIGMILASIGLIIICMDKGLEGGIGASIALITCAISWGISFTLIKKWQAPALPTSMWMSIITLPLFALASCLFEGGYSSLIQEMAQASLLSWGCALYTSWINLVLAGAMLFYLMKTESAAKVAPYNMLLPIFGSLFAYLLLQEPLHLSMAIAGSFILSGVVISQFGSRFLFFIRQERISL